MGPPTDFAGMTQATPPINLTLVVWRRPPLGLRTVERGGRRQTITLVDVVYLMETRSEHQQKAASASRAGGGSGNEETTGPYGDATGPRPVRERPGELEVPQPKEDNFGAERGGGDYGRERDERRGGKGKGKGPLGREESRSTPTPTPSPAPRPAPRNNKDGPSGDAWETLSEEECQVCFVVIHAHATKNV